MKSIGLILAFFALSTVAYSQTVSADEVIRKARSGKDVTYENVTISGILDLTDWAEDGDNLPRRRWYSGSDNKIENTIRGKMSFVNCEFEDDFIAYFHDDRSEYTFVTHFDDDIIFKNCTFKRDAEFKYSEFQGEVDFSGATFYRDANFKYAEFDENTNFSNVSFEDDANFKYAEFERPTDFTNSRFDELANFKYAEMQEGVKFTNAKFDGFWDLKYAEMDDEVDLSGIEVNRDLDTKYTKINGKSFNRYLLSGN